MSGPHVVEIDVRWGDLDAQGHVNNALVADYLQEARVEFLLAGGRSTMLDTGVVVVGHQVEYRAPITFGIAPVVAELSVVERGASRFRLAYQLSQAGVVVARARTTLCPFDLAHQRVRRLTAAEQEWFDAQLVEAEAFSPLAQVDLRGRGHVHPVRPRWSDVDRFHHVNNVRIFDYVQEARIAMTTTADPTMARQGTTGADHAMADPDTAWLVARQDVDYLDQVGYRLEPYHLVTSVVSLGRSSVTLNAELVDPLQASLPVLCRARTVLVCADGSGRPKPLDDDHRARLGAWLVAPPVA
ncbi:acyl-CoA thioesterase [Aestuariimicrobium ganziense]|uniref:acyl-CoA thioesterase n=1 Tax=Aestuariimicrobium ganziense TaxID=2773677 RepID=UPI001942A447|nr:thioesterase family protein [Aestuariimicrobium ganziense]